MTSVSLGPALASDKNSAVLKNYDFGGTYRMKKVLAFLLALSMCLALVTGCTKIDSEDPAQKGPEFDVYLGTKVMNLDPAISYTDENAVKILSLIFEGLTKLDENGKRKFGIRDKLAYAAGDAGCNLSFGLKSTVQTFWLVFMMMENFTPRKFKG